LFEQQEEIKKEKNKNEIEYQFEQRLDESFEKFQESNPKNQEKIDKKRRRRSFISPRQEKTQLKWRR
jgi:hypothetical protein